MANKTWVGGDSGNEGDYSVAANWSPSGVPTTGDNVRIPAGNSQDIDAGLNQSAVAIGDFIVENGYTGKIGTSSANLQIDPDYFRFNGASAGVCYIDLGSAAISVDIVDTSAGATGLYGLFLIGTGIDNLSIQSGEVGLAPRIGEAATVADVVVLGGNLYIGEGCTITNVSISDGSILCWEAVSSTVNVYGGTFTIGYTATIATLNVFGGTCVIQTTGTITTLNLYGGIVQCANNGLNKTITTLTLYNGDITFDPDFTSFSTISQGDRPVTLSVANA